MGSSQRFLGREGRSTWSGRDSLKVLAGLAKGEICPNLSCDFIWEKKKKGSREGGGCVLRRGPRGGEKGSGTQASCSRKPGTQGRVFARKSSGPVPSFRAGNFCGSMLVPHPPILQKGKVASPPVGLISVPCGAGLLPATQPQSLFTFPRASGSCRDESSLSGKKPKQVSLYYLVLPHY